MNKICKNCKWVKEIVNHPTMDGKAPINISCMFLNNGVKVRGIQKHNDTCDDFDLIELNSIWKDNGNFLWQIFEIKEFGEIKIEKIKDTNALEPLTEYQSEEFERLFNESDDRISKICEDTASTTPRFIEDLVNRTQNIDYQYLIKHFKETK